jgi:elongation factor P
MGPAIRNDSPAGSAHDSSASTTSASNGAARLCRLIRRMLCTMIKATELTKNMFIRWEGQLQMVLDTDHVKPGKGPAYVQAKMKNMQTGTIKFNRINSSDKVEEVEIERRQMQYLYESSGVGKGPFVFMNNETFEQVEIDSVALPREQSQWLVENIECMVTSFEGHILSVDLPASVELKVTETAPQARGATATNQSKEATVQTGAKIRVPAFIETDQVVRVSPQTGEYLGKA